MALLTSIIGSLIVGIILLFFGYLFRNRIKKGLLDLFGITTVKQNFNEVLGQLIKHKEEIRKVESILSKMSHDELSEVKKRISRQYDAIDRITLDFQKYQAQFEQMLLDKKKLEKRGQS